MGHLILGKFAREHLHYSTPPYLDLVNCWECGSTELEVFYTSRIMGPFLSRMGIPFKTESGVMKERMTRPSRREACTV
jgi:hypothetical protein